MTKRTPSVFELLAELEKSTNTVVELLVELQDRGVPVTPSGASIEDALNDARALAGWLRHVQQEGLKRA
jgi:hypothetical protein